MTELENTTEQEEVQETSTDDVAVSQEDSNEVPSDNDADTQEVEETVEEDAADEVNDEDDDDADAMVPLSKLKKVRNEAKNLRERLKTAESRIVELETNPTSDTNVRELEERVNTLTTTLNKERLTTHLQREAEKQNAIEPSALILMVDATKVEWDGDKPTNVEDVVADLKETYPKLFSTHTVGRGDVGNRSEPRGRFEGMSNTQLMAEGYKNSKRK